MASRKRSSAWFRLGLIGIGLLGVVLVAQAFKHSIDRQGPRSDVLGQSGTVVFAVLRDAAPAPGRAFDI